MSGSLLPLLPEILTLASHRSREALESLGVSCSGTSQEKNRSLSSDGRGCLDIHTTSPPRWLAMPDLPVLIDAIAGTNDQPSLRGRVGFVWLGATHSACDEWGAELQNNESRFDTSSSSARAALIHLALKLFFIRELSAHGAVVAIAPQSGLQNCTLLLMEAVFGLRPRWATLDAVDSSAGALRLLVCRTDAKIGVPVECKPLLIGSRAPLTEWIANTRSSVRGMAALAMRPGRGVVQLMKAWTGNWVVSHPESMALAVLRESSGP